jgi:hypothetical protein
VSFVPYSTHSLTREKVMWDDVREREGEMKENKAGGFFLCMIALVSAVQDFCTAHRAAVEKSRRLTVFRMLL